MNKTELRQIIKEELTEVSNNRPLEDRLGNLIEQLEYIQHNILKGRLDVGPKTENIWNSIVKTISDLEKSFTINR